jgi:hypothetical protein
VIFALRFMRAAAFLVVTSLASLAHAADDRCRGFHSLFAPLPDPCLEVIDTDRPHQTDTPHVIGAGHTQFESAVVAVPLGGTLGAPEGQRDAHLVLLDDIYKFGLFSRSELQLTFKHFDYVLGKERFAPPGPLSVRMKLNLVEEHKGIPAITFVPWGFFPMAPDQTLRGGGYVFWGWELGKHFEVEMNAGVLFSASNSRAPKPPYVVVLATALTYTIIGNFRVFVDIYATGYDIQAGTGALWAFTRDLQVDLGTYIGVNGDESVATPFLGFSFRR